MVKLADCINPDGIYTDEDRARRRGLTPGSQDVDGMSPIRGWLTPKPVPPWKRCWPSSPPRHGHPPTRRPAWTARPAKQAIDGDTRSGAQRNHDALNAGLRALLASGKLGQHNGLPASIVVTTTLSELEAGAGTALTAGGSLLPMSDVARLASHAHHYLAIFDKGRALALYHTKRLASPAQRIVLYAKDRGCSAPGCTVPAYFTEVHHVTGYARSKTTDVDDLTLACRVQHRIVQPAAGAPANAKTV
ncbi:hypothetical protein I553_2934 [Mycobacterium xenopi 4042]|uniref:HNH nuclease domain-containing protein n=1 Tax=Mycobacterium xenopi 4042 TaxID=1299334 RepID=X8EDI4_MYCXE|nr:hypothetical protein I553_2934 [Mycobacterium xenopi 4042]